MADINYYKDYLWPADLPLEKQAEYRMLPDALPARDVAALHAAELGDPALAEGLEAEYMGMAAIASGWAEGRTIYLTGPPPPLKRDDFRRFLIEDGKPLPKFWFTEEERRAAQAHQA